MTVTIAMVIASPELGSLGLVSWSFLKDKITSIFSDQMSGQVSRGSAREYQADERAGVVGLSSRVSG